MNLPQSPELTAGEDAKIDVSTKASVTGGETSTKATANQQREFESTKDNPHTLSTDFEKNSPNTVEPQKSRAINWSLLIQILAWITTIIIGVLSLIIKSQVNDVKREVGTVDTRVRTVESVLIKGQFTITSPEDGSDVSLTEIVRGKTPFPEMNHYIVVTPIETGSDHIQDKPVSIYAGGLFTGETRFGQGDLGKGEKFIVRVLASKSSLIPNILSKVPEDAIFSEPIIVTRRR